MSAVGKEKPVGNAVGRANGRVNPDGKANCLFAFFTLADAVPDGTTILLTAVPVGLTEPVTGAELRTVPLTAVPVALGAVAVPSVGRTMPVTGNLMLGRVKGRLGKFGSASASLFFNGRPVGRPAGRPVGKPLGKLKPVGKAVGSSKPDGRN